MKYCSFLYLLIKQNFASDRTSRGVFFASKLLGMYTVMQGKRKIEMHLSSGQVSLLFLLSRS